MKRLIALCLVPLTLLAFGARAADDAPGAKPAAPESKPVPKEEKSITHHKVTINGHEVSYTATAGNLVIKNDKDEPEATIFYVAYTADGGKDTDHRPVSFAYNGGPGSSSIWLHMGAFGPMQVVTSNAEPTPPPPYDVVPNANSLLDKTDLVFIDAVSTGFSQPVGKAEGKDFWGVDEDVEAFGRFIQRYISVNDRWNSPKFLLGESYGTTRSANLVDWLQNKGIACNGVILISSVLNYGDTFPGTDLEYVTYLPSYAAIAWYHDKLPNKPADLKAFLEEVRAFARGEYADALFQGGRLPQAEYDEVLHKLHAYTGLSEQYLKEANLRVNATRFRAELLRDSDRTMGRYDARFEGVNMDDAEETPDYDASDTAISAAFTAAFNRYLRSDLGYSGDADYHVTGYDVIHNWDWKHPLPGRPGFFMPPLPDVQANLADAIRKNPHLKVFSANGYFDLATPFFKTEFDLDQMDLPADLMKNVQFGYYPSGHMIYLNPVAHKQLTADLDKFYDSANAP
ncbi:MAG: S10 family peptidase [Gammaproteobacteria bacterium]|jgi:carboxypeptidase C (cathepsin A)|nr:peptidase S10 [Gammaproteobacteria bacterium]